jgi:glucosyl-3-phosphoglycerate synthase
MDDEVAPWTLSLDDFDVEKVMALACDTTITVVISAKDNASTIERVIDAVLARPGVVNQLIIVNDHSLDATAAVAENRGARVIQSEGVGGKGAALRAGLKRASSELIVFLAADMTDTTPDVVLQMVQPLLERPEIQLVKAYYQRPFHNMPTGGSRVNELAARPILSLLFPGLDAIRQPLAGETAGRRSTFEEVSLEPNDGVDIAMLIDSAKKFGLQGLAQVDLGIRRHRNRPLEELRPMAVKVLSTALLRYGVVLPRGVPRETRINLKSGLAPVPLGLIASTN